MTLFGLYRKLKIPSRALPARPGPGIRSSRLSFLVATTVLVVGSALAASTAQAADIPCVRKAMVKVQRSADQSVRFTLVSLHANGIAGFGAGKLFACEVGRCLKTSGWFNMLLSDRKSGTQPFNVSQPLRLAIDGIYPLRSTPTRLHPGEAGYAFYPQCAQDLLTGNDQWGNHWTISFQ